MEYGIPSSSRPTTPYHYTPSSSGYSRTLPPDGDYYQQYPGYPESLHSHSRAAPSETLYSDDTVTYPDGAPSWYRPGISSGADALKQHGQEVPFYPEYEYDPRSRRRFSAFLEGLGNRIMSRSSHPPAPRPYEPDPNSESQPYPSAPPESREDPVLPMPIPTDAPPIEPVAEPEPEPETPVQSFYRFVANLRSLPFITPNSFSSRGERAPITTAFQPEESSARSLARLHQYRAAIRYGREGEEEGERLKGRSWYVRSVGQEVRAARNAARKIGRERERESRRVVKEASGHSSGSSNAPLRSKPIKSVNGVPDMAYSYSVGPSPSGLTAGNGANLNGSVHLRGPTSSSGHTASTFKETQQITSPPVVMSVPYGYSYAYAYPAQTAYMMPASMGYVPGPLPMPTGVPGFEAATGSQPVVPPIPADNLARSGSIVVPPPAHIST